MQSVQVTISHKDGMHTRPSSVFVREAAKFKSEIFLKSNEVSVNGKSIMGILMLALGPGSMVELSAEGPDETEALQVLSAVLSGDFK